MKKVLIVCLLFGIHFSSFGQKNILIEKFTNLYCGACPDRSILLTNLEEQYPELIWISHYSPSYFEYNPMPFSGATEMWQEVQISGTPLAIVDRVPYNNSLGSTSASWETRIQQQQNIEDYVDIEFSNVNFNESTRALTLDVTSTFHTLPDNPENFRVYLYVTEDEVRWRQHSYYNNTPGHPLEGLGDVIQEYYHQNVLRAMPGGLWGEADIIPDNPTLGQGYVKTFSYQIPGDYVPFYIELTAAVGQHDPSNFKNRPILNAERIKLPEYITTNTLEQDITQFNAFPNPTNDVLYLDFKEQPTQLTLINMQGAIIQNFAVDGLNAHIDLRNYPSGNYILQVVKDGKMISQKIIIH